MADHSSFCDAKGICFALQEKTSPAERRERESSFYEKGAGDRYLRISGGKGHYLAVRTVRILHTASHEGA